LRGKNVRSVEFVDLIEHLEAVSVTVHQFQSGYALIVSYSDLTITPGQANPNAYPFGAP